MIRVAAPLYLKTGGSVAQTHSWDSTESDAKKRAKQFPYTAYLSKADAIIDLCKLKTHGMMGLTCAIKNFFGSIPGTSKPEFHYKYPRAEDFANVLVDLYEYSKPRLCICDAVVGMEGNGPTQGMPREIGCLITSRNGHILDAVAADLIGLEYADPKYEQILDEMSLQDLIPAQSSVFFHVLGEGLPGKIADFAAARILTPFPKLDPSGCIGCGKCAHVCPAKAITMKKRKPEINRKVCIHCFCCQEFCPQGAMKVGRTAVMRAYRKLTPKG